MRTKFGSNLRKAPIYDTSSGVLDLLRADPSLQDAHLTSISNNDFSEITRLASRNIANRCALFFASPL